MRGLSIPLPHYSSLRLPQICCVETLGRTLTHIQPSVLPRAPRQDLPVRSLALTSSDSIHTLQQQTEVWVLLHCEPAHMQNFSLNTREKKKSQFPMGTGRFFLSAIGFCHLRIKCKIHAATRNQAGYMHSCDWLYFTCVENKSHVRTRRSHVICFPHMWYSNPHFKSGEICFSTFPHNSDAIWLFSHKISNMGKETNATRQLDIWQANDISDMLKITISHVLLNTFTCKLKFEHVKGKLHM